MRPCIYQNKATKKGSYMTKAQLIALLTDKVKNEGYSFFTDCTHKAETIQSVIESVLNDYGDIKDTDEVTADDLQDNLMEACDSETPIYTSDLMDWLADNTITYDEMVDELGQSGERSDIVRQTAGAFCYSLERDAMSVLNSLLANE